MCKPCLCALGHARLPSPLGGSGGLVALCGGAPAGECVALHTIILRPPSLFFLRLRFKNDELQIKQLSCTHTHHSSLLLHSTGSPSSLPCARCTVRLQRDTTASHRPPAKPNPPFRNLSHATSHVHSWHFQGQKLRLGGGSLGADPTYLLYRPSRSRGGI